MGILAIAITVIVASMATAIALASRHREQARAGTLLVNAAEHIKGAPYVACDGGAPTYDKGSVPAGWTIDDSRVQTLSETGQLVDCPSADTKLQQVTVVVTAPSGYKATTQVVKRNKA
jgi:hypothetical protein